MKIEGYFRNIKDANKAVDELKKKGYEDSFIDMNEHYVLDVNPGTNLAGTSTGTSDSSLVLNSGESLDNPEQGPLTAASPMVSGMGGFEEIADIGCRVVVNVGEKDSDMVKEVISSSGGDTRNPNFKMPDRVGDISSDEIINTMIDDMKRKG